MALVLKINLMVDLVLAAIALMLLRANALPAPEQEGAVRVFEQEGAVRVFGVPGNQLEGRLEIYINGRWGTVCNDGFDAINAVIVVCRQLGGKGITDRNASTRRLLLISLGMQHQ